jgi:hypothetical protein
MKVCHWTQDFRSGMNHVSRALVIAEQKLGIESCLAYPDNKTSWVLDADINVIHTFRPKFLSKKTPTVWVGHTSPDYLFSESINIGEKSYGTGDPWMYLQHNLRVSDARVTFWPRHQKIYESLSDNGTKIHCVSLGVDKRFWKPVGSLGKFSGEPSLFTCESTYSPKWPYDLFVTWPWVVEEFPESHLHSPGLLESTGRWFFPLANRNGCSFSAHISSLLFNHVELRNAYCSIDYMIGLVRYGDHNLVSLEANACGAKTISYIGNPYSDFWITEGDQRQMAKELISILKGEVEPRQKEVVPDIQETAKAMKEIYDGL